MIKKIVVITLIFLFLMTGISFAETNVGGIIDTDTTWTNENSPYIITGNIGIEKNITLTIEPGVQVLADGYYYIGIKGKIIADGTESGPIIFSSKNFPDYDSYDWQGIKFLTDIDGSQTWQGIKFLTDIDGSQTWQGSLFNNVEISFAHRGLSSDRGIGNSEPLITIQNSIFHSIGFDGIYLWGIPCVIQNNYFTKLNLGNINDGYSFAIDSRGPTITGNIVEYSKSSGIRGNVNCSPCPNPIISENRLNNLGGIGIDGTQSIISKNLLFNNGDAGIVVNSDSEVQYNTVYFNKVGILSQFGNFIISNNNIFSNLEYNFKPISANEVNASNNWWGTTDTSEIDNFIFDYFDDFTLGKVNYFPFLTSSDLDAPSQFPTEGDFNGDGRPDILWQNQSTGDIVFWQMDGTTVLSQSLIGNVPDTNWKIVDYADFNQDGKSDILWQNQATGDVCIWLMDGTTLIGVIPGGGVSDPYWRIASAVDYSGDGKPDYLWQHQQREIYTHGL